MEILNYYLSGIIMPLLLISAGIFFAFKFKLFYVLHPIKSFKDMLCCQGGFKALSVALAGTLGIGNIVGVASAISAGGAGSVFWMWLSALCAMSLKYAEVKLSLIFRCKEGANFRGGAPYYINGGLRKKLGNKAAYFLSCIFAVFCSINSLSTGNLVQINSISKIFPISSLLLGIIVALVCYVCINGGVKRIEKITSSLIPFLTAVYVIICLIIIFRSITDLPAIINLIFKDAFSTKSAISGFYGYGISTAIRYGISRGVLSNEAGCGTSPCAHATSKNNDPHKQGCLGIFEVFVDTILLCSLTAFVILLEGTTGLEPMELVVFSFESGLGWFSKITISCLCVCFAFATIITQYFYGEEALKYLSKNDLIASVFKVIYCIVTIVGAVIPMWLMWEISDLAMAVMTIINIVCLFLLKKYL